ncbi:MAG: TolC family protein [Chitinophagaceae bacterium]|nr:TolC family protein [Chitinophagaceae bacterium]
MRFRLLPLVFVLLIFTSSFSQPVTDKWDLQRAVEYALKNNISVRQADLQTRFSALVLQQNKAGQFPSLNFNGSAGYRLGRSENPTTGVLEDNNFFNLGMQLQSQVTLFNWFAIKNTIAASRLSWEADKQQVAKAQNDIALNVAVAYLQILLSREQVNLARVQVDQSSEQLRITRKRVDAGSLPELNAAELEAQLARDSAMFVTAEGSVQQFILQMKALLNLDAAVPFDVVVPPVGMIPVEPLAELQPDAVYASAIANLPQQKVNELRLQSAEKSVAAAKAFMYPSISAFGSLSTSAISFQKRPIYEQVIAGYTTNAGLRANVGGTFYPIEIPDIQSGTTVVDYFRPGRITKQFSNNFGQSVGIGLSVPIFNGRQARSGWDRSKLVVKQWELTAELDNMTLKQDIYRAYTDATTALQKYNANRKTVEASQKAYNFAQKRYELALLSTFELVTSQNNLQRARIDMLYAQYDYVFKIKLLEFYKGQGLKL